MQPELKKIDENKIPQALKGKWVVLWDGDCGFCRRSIEWVKSKDKHGVLYMTPYQQHMEWLPNTIYVMSKKQVHLMSPTGQFWGGAIAAQKVLDLIGYHSLSTFLGLPGARFFSDWSYRLVARNRLLFSKLFFRK